MSAFFSIIGDLDEEKSKRRRIEREKKMFEQESHKYKTQLQVATSNGGGTSGVTNSDVESGNFCSYINYFFRLHIIIVYFSSFYYFQALRELRIMQQQLDDAHAEIAELKNLRSADSRNGSLSSVTNRSSSGAVASGPMRVRQSAERANTEKANNNNLGFYGGFIEQSSDVVDRRLEQLAREKRELIAKNLEENKEKMELSQKLLQVENELAASKSKITKITLEKERLERKMMKAGDLSHDFASNDAENIVNGSIDSVRFLRSRK